MHTTRRLPIVLGILTTLVLAACGGGTAATSGPGGPGATSGGSTTQGPGGGTTTQAPGGGETVDACALLTAAEIEDVTGLVANTGLPGPQAGVFASGCLWELIDEDSMVPPSFTLGVMTTGGKDYYDTYFAPFNDEAGYEPIEGLGDIAVDADFGAVHVVSGDAFFQVQYIGGGFGPDDSTTLATELAKRVVANLGA
jgi:hypothetical protein